MITEQQLKEWEEIEKKATPGPWEAKPESNSKAGWYSLFWILPPPEHQSQLAQTIDRFNAEFSAMARTAIPLLIETIRELQTAYVDLEDAFGQRIIRRANSPFFECRQPKTFYFQRVIRVEQTTRIYNF